MRASVPVIWEQMGGHDSLGGSRTESGAIGRGALLRLEHDRLASMASFVCLGCSVPAPAPAPHRAKLSKILHCLESHRCPEWLSQEASAGQPWSCSCSPALGNATCLALWQKLARGEGGGTCLMGALHSP